MKSEDRRIVTISRAAVSARSWHLGDQAGERVFANAAYDQVAIA